MKRLMIALFAAAALVVGGVAAYRHFAAGRSDAVLPQIPTDAVLLTLYWAQRGETADACFALRLTRSGGAYTLSDGEESRPLTSAQWRQAEQMLRTGDHRAPIQLPEGVEVLDATESTLTVTWQTASGEAVTAVYDGGNEPELHRLLTGFLTAEP